MSLNWANPNYTKAWDEMTPAKRQTIIFGTMTLGMPRITVKTAEEFHRRYVMFCVASGGKPQLTLQDILDSVGLSTNASALAYPTFKKVLIERLESHVQIKK